MLAILALVVALVALVLKLAGHAASLGKLDLVLLAFCLFIAHFVVDVGPAWTRRRQ